MSTDNNEVLEEVKHYVLTPLGVCVARGLDAEHAKELLEHMASYAQKLAASDELPAMVYTEGQWHFISVAAVEVLPARTRHPRGIRMREDVGA